MTTPNQVAEVARRLTKAQREALLKFDDRVWSRREIHTTTWSSLYRKGVASHIMAAGYLFFDWTPLGAAVRAHLEASEHE